MCVWGGAGLTLTLILTIRFKACVTMVPVMKEATNRKVIGLLYDLQGHREHEVWNSDDDVKILKVSSVLTKNYTALLNLYNPDHNLPGLMIKSESSETKHITYRK